MPTYNLTNPDDRLKLAKALKDPKVLAWILEKHYGKQAVTELRAAWRLSQQET